MPIPGVPQPDILPVEAGLRLRKYGGTHAFALPWYQDIETVSLVDGGRVPYSPERLDTMYRYLNAHGELYWIEILEHGAFSPIGDVTFSQTDMPIVIGPPQYRGRKIGGKVVAALIRRGRELGYPRLFVQEIYDYNVASRKCFERLGFRAYEKTEKGSRFVCELTSA